MLKKIFLPLLLCAFYAENHAGQGCSRPRSYSAKFHDINIINIQVAYTLAPVKKQKIQYEGILTIDDDNVAASTSYAITIEDNRLIIAIESGEYTNKNLPVNMVNYPIIRRALARIFTDLYLHTPINP